MLSTYEIIIAAITASLVAYAVNSVSYFYSRLKYYPNGPKPLPIVGNLLMIARNLNHNPSYFFKTLAKNYGGLYTFWFGSQPAVFISSVELAKKAFNQTDCCDRWHPTVESKMTAALFADNRNIILMNWTDEYKKLRRVSVNGLRIFLSTNKLSEIAIKIIDETASKMLFNEITSKPFKPNAYIASIFVRILAKTIYGKRVEWADPRIDQIQKTFEIIQFNTLKVFITENIPALKLIFDPMKEKHVGIQTFEMLNEWITERLETKQSDDNYKSVTDLQIQLRNQLSDKSEHNDEYLNDSQLFGNINALFFASSDTIYNSFKWILLLMAYYPEMQQNLRSEINLNIGEKAPALADKEKCCFVNAFICETLRFRNVTPFGVCHTTLDDTYIDEHKIPKGCLLVLQQDSILNDTKYWVNPECFYPYRFLDSDQHFNGANFAAFVPFSTGRRVCIGDKFAMNLMFLILTRLLQATSGYRIQLFDKLNADLEPKKFGFLADPKPYYVQLIKE